MSDRWVVDASLGLAWVLPAQATDQTDRLLRQLHQGVELVVPSIWFQEIANALLVLERRKRLRAADRRQALAALQALVARPDFEGATLAFSKLSDLAQLHGLSIYDATYLELALRRALPLGTKDEPLQSAAQKCGVRLLLAR